MSFRRVAAALSVLALGAWSEPNVPAASVATAAPAPVTSRVAEATVAVPEAAAAPAPAAETAAAPFGAFWTGFRAAVLEGDAARLQSLAVFPFRTRGPGDDDTVLSHDAAAFTAMLGDLLSADPGLGAEPDTMRAWIERLPAAPSGTGVSIDDRQARLGNFVFERVSGQWRWTMAYVDSAGEAP